jgi:hypothetical protein
MFNVCWCGPPSCSDDFDFNIKAGEFEVVGPFPKIAQCTATVPCSLQFLGSAFSNIGGLLFLRTGTCGSSGATFSSWSGFVNPKQLQVADNANGSVFDMTAFLSPMSLTPQPSHRMCWSYSPSAIADYKVDVGSFMMLPSGSPIQPVCSLGIRCAFSLLGAGFSASNQILVSAASSCGMTGAASFMGFENPAQVQVPSAEYVLGTALSGQTGIYKLCWAHDPISPSEFYFLLEVGTLQICGPSGVHGLTGGELTPIISASFTLEIQGICLSETTRIRIIAAGPACGTTTMAHDPHLSGPLADTPDVAGVAGSTSDSSTSRAWHNLVVSQTLVLQVCWCQADVCANANPSDWSVYAGSFTVRGPSAMHIISSTGVPDLIAGVHFELNLDGLGMTTLDRIRIAGEAVPCGSSFLLDTSALSENSRTLLKSAAQAGTTGSASTSAKWTPLKLNRAASFRVCWCGSQCSTGSEFSLDVGTLNILGPHYAYHISCIVATSCYLTLHGTGFSSTSAVLWSQVIVGQRMRH